MGILRIAATVTTTNPTISMGLKPLDNMVGMAPCESQTAHIVTPEKARQSVGMSTTYHAYNYGTK